MTVFDWLALQNSMPGPDLRVAVDQALRRNYAERERYLQTGERAKVVITLRRQPTIRLIDLAPMPRDIEFAGWIEAERDHILRSGMVLASEWIDGVREELATTVKRPFESAVFHENFTPLHQETGHGWDCPECSTEVLIWSSTRPGDESDLGGPAVFHAGDRWACSNTDCQAFGSMTLDGPIIDTEA